LYCSGINVIGRKAGVQHGQQAGFERPQQLQHGGGTSQLQQQQQGAAQSLHDGRDVNGEQLLGNSTRTMVGSICATVSSMQMLTARV
jgi:hypothetical protein